MVCLTLCLMFILSLLIISTKHPMSMGISILMQTLMVSLILSFLSPSSWYSYILFLIMVGGMLILFMYMTTVASNEKFKFSFKLAFSLIVFSILIMLMLMFLEYNVIMFSKSMESILQNFSFYLSLNKFMNLPTILISFTLISYLLLTLIVVIKIINLKKGPLRMNN